MSTANFGWLVADKVIRMVAGLLVGLMVARYLGAERFGLFNYGLALVAFLIPLAELGLDPVVRRVLINSPAEAGRTLAAACYLRLGAGAFGYLVLVACVLAGKEPQIGPLLLVLGLGLFNAALFTPDIWLQANLRARVAVVASWLALGAGAALKAWFVWRKAGLVSFAWVSVAEMALGGVWLWVFARKAGMPVLRLDAFWKIAKNLLAASWPLLLSGAAVALYMRMDVVMVRLIVGERESGIYAAAVRLSELGYFIPMALASSMLPSLLKRKEEGAQPYRVAIQRYYDLSAALGYAISLPMALFARVIVGFLYGPAFAGAGAVLTWHALAAVFVFLGVARSQYLTNEGRQRFSLLTTMLGALTKLLLNWVLIPRHGAMGAAWSTVVAYGVAGCGATWLHPELRGNAGMQLRALLIPFRCWRYFSRR